MANVIFDKLTYVDRLKSGGVTESSARAHADALDVALRDSVATKADLAEVRKEIAGMRADILKYTIPVLLGQVAIFLAAGRLFFG